MITPRQKAENFVAQFKHTLHPALVDTIVDGVEDLLEQEHTEYSSELLGLREGIEILRCSVADTLSYTPEIVYASIRNQTEKLLARPCSEWARLQAAREEILLGKLRHAQVRILQESLNVLTLKNACAFIRDGYRDVPARLAQAAKKALDTVLEREEQARKVNLESETQGV